MGTDCFLAEGARALMLVLVLLGLAGCASGRELECLSWWRWDTPDECRARGCRVADLVNCVYPKPQTATLKRIHVVQVRGRKTCLSSFFVVFSPALLVCSGSRSFAHRTCAGLPL